MYGPDNHLIEVHMLNLYSGMPTDFLLLEYNETIK